MAKQSAALFLLLSPKSLGGKLAAAVRGFACGHLTGTASGRGRTLTDDPVTASVAVKAARQLTAQFALPRLPLDVEAALCSRELAHKYAMRPLFDGRCASDVVTIPDGWC